MIEFIQVSGSFVTVWLGLWFFLAALLAACYPMCRERLLTWHPTLAGNLSLLLLLFPFLLSLSCTVLLFLPALESTLVSLHCHVDCTAHAPLIDLPGIEFIGMSLAIAAFFTIFRRALNNIRASGQLRIQLSRLATQRDEYLELEDDQPFVFALGWWNAKIYITKGLMQHCSKQDLQVILAHEQAHTRRHDNIRLLVVALLTSVLPKKLAETPVEDFHLLIESACDFEASKRYGDLEVAETLLKVQRLSPAQWNLGSAVFTAAFTGSEIERRINALIQGRQLSLAQQAAFRSSIILFFVASLGLVQPLHHSVEFFFSLH